MLHRVLSFLDPASAVTVQRSSAASGHFVLRSAPTKPLAGAIATASFAAPLNRLSLEYGSLASIFGLGRVGWHSFRRGMARDMLNSGCTLATILDAGGWRSSAFLKYLSRRDVDARVAYKLAELHSNSE